MWVFANFQHSFCHVRNVSYNDVIRYYKRAKYNITIVNSIKGIFRYKLSTAGLSENFSYFVASRNFGQGKSKEVVEVEIHHNLKVQSAHNDRIYYTADISVCEKDGAKTVVYNKNRRHSFIQNNRLITFFEVKNLNPFPEVLFGFSGIVLEVMPNQIIKNNSINDEKPLRHLSPAIVFSGGAGEHVMMVAEDLKTRYGYNVIFGLYNNKGQIYSFKDLNQI